MSNFNQPAFRERRIRWLDEEINNHSWNREQLNNELFANEQRLFQQDSDNLIDLHSDFAPPTTPGTFPTSPPTYMYEQPPGYMEQPSAFMLEPPSRQASFADSYTTNHSHNPDPALAGPPTESTFLECYPSGNATLTYQNEDNKLETIRDLNLEIIKNRSAILGMAFERGRSGPQLHLETLTSATALPFVRYLYTGSYALRSLIGEPGDYYEDVPTSVLLHCQLYRLADIYDLPDLKSQAYVNVLRQCEFGCSSPDKPIDVCAAIRFAYKYLQEHENLIDAVLHYCVSCFLQHRLAEDEEFKKLAYDLRPFHQALCRISMSREFKDETATAIVQMPFKPYIPETYASREDVTATKFDHVFHFHATDQFDNAGKKRRRSEVKPEAKDEAVVLPIRVRQESFIPDDWPLPSGFVPVQDMELDEDYKFGSKRRASSFSKNLAPTTSGISQLRVMNPDEPVPEEEEYEIVERPEVAIGSQDSDSDAADFVEIKREPYSNGNALAIRTKDQESTSAVNRTVDNDSDSEWSLV